MNHVQDQFHVMRSDSSLMTRQKSKLVFAVQDASRPSLSIHSQSVLDFLIPEDSEMFIINVAKLFSFFQTTRASWKWLVLFLKLQSDLLLRYVYSMYPKKKMTIWETNKDIYTNRQSEKNLIYPWFLLYGVDLRVLLGNSLQKVSNIVGKNHNHNHNHLRPSSPGRKK